MALLEIADLRLAIGLAPILHGLSLKLDAGRILGLAGESGSGKSMTLLSLIRLLPENARLSGKIELDGADIGGKSETELCAVRGRDIGMVFQEPLSALNPLIPIGRQVAETIRLHRKVSRAESLRLASETLDLVDLPADRFPRGRFPHQLSGGQRQRVAIAIAIALRPKLLIADEPTTALDVTTQATILALLRRLVKIEGMAMILVSHDLPAIAAIADDVAIMQAGRIVEAGETTAVLGNPTHPHTRALIAAIDAPPLWRPSVPTAAPIVLQAEGVGRTYSQPKAFFWQKAVARPAVTAVDLTLKAGEILGLVGESGSGKSTLLRRLLALDPPETGIVRLDGDIFAAGNGQSARHLRQQIQVVFQDPYGSFDPHWRVERIVAEPLGLLDPPPSREMRRQIVERTLESVGLTAGDADKLPHQFSGGERQRIAIARALVVNPKILVLDEATSALDTTIKAQILSLLADLAKSKRTSLLFASHDLTAIRSFADRVMVMSDGKIVEIGETEDIFLAPSHPYTRQLLAAAPGFRKTLEARRRGEILWDAPSGQPEN